MRLNVPRLAIATFALVALIDAAGAKTARTISPLMGTETTTLHMQGQQIGGSTTTRTQDLSGWHIDTRSTLELKRGAAAIKMSTQTQVDCGPQLQPIGFRATRTDASGTMTVVGIVKTGTPNNVLHLTTEQSGAKTASTVALPPNTYLASCLDVVVRQRLLAGQGIDGKAWPADTTSHGGFSIVLEDQGAVTTMTISAAPRQDATGGWSIQSSVVGIVTKEEVDRTARTISALIQPLGLEVRGSGQANTVASAAGKPDMLAMSMGMVQSVPANAKRVTYRVHTPDADAFVVPEDARQRVTKRDNQTLDIVVDANAGIVEKTTLTAEQRTRMTGETQYETTRDVRITDVVRKTMETIRVKSIPVFWTSWVFRHITNKNYTTGYAPAVTTLLNKTGDCTEHAVLLSTLLRAQGIPTRIANGFVVDGTTAAYHEWVEAYDDSQSAFIAIDPAFNAAPAGANRVKLAVGTTEPNDILQRNAAAMRILTPGFKVEVISVDK